MKLETEFEFLEELLKPWVEKLGSDFPGYRNHCYRVLNFCLSQFQANSEDIEKLTIVTAFHDLGIWSHGITLDYLGPSVELATAYLRDTNREAWTAEVVMMIEMHHKILPIESASEKLTEIFRRADVTDLSLGYINNGVDRDFVRSVLREIPNKGFHRRLLQLQWNRLKKHPFNPFPVFRY